MAKKLTKRDESRIKEARGAIGRLSATMNQGYNRFGAYGDNCRGAIKRWQAVLAEYGLTE